jgi:hypothetical protein
VRSEFFHRQFPAPEHDIDLVARYFASHFERAALSGATSARGLEIRTDIFSDVLMSSHDTFAS